ncbi:MAG: hypothetical protein ACOX6Q_00535, partial [Candidatus Dojkabacteria bacterium]
TIDDIELYKEYILKYKIKDVVVGSIFTEKKSDEPVAFLSKEKLFYKEIYEEDIIISELKNITNVYRRSTEVMKKYKVKNLKKLCTDFSASI